MQKNSGYFGRLGSALSADFSTMFRSAGSMLPILKYGYWASCLAGIVFTSLTTTFVAMLVGPLIIGWLLKP